MDISQVRICFVAVLRKLNWGSPRQFGGSIYDQIAKYAVDLGFIPPSKTGEEPLGTSDKVKAQEVFWSFIVQGILLPGYNDQHLELPFFRLTDYGKSVLDSPDPVPYDTDGYLEHLKSVAPNLDSIAMTYVAEGLDCFVRGNYMASLVMLGVGSEKLMLDLAQALQQALPPDEATKMQKSIEKDRISKIYVELKKHFSPHINGLPPALRDGLELLLDGVFTIIRIHRNEAGHPTGKRFDRLTVLGLFSVFPSYCERMSQLIEYLRSNGL